MAAEMESSSPGFSANPYLFEIEKRKKPSGLAHEQGAGTPCLNCEEKCPGLDLHFWRKTCRACACSQFFHRGPEGAPDPGLLRIGSLFSSRSKSNPPTNHFGKELDIFLGNGIRERMVMDWVPPNTHHELATRYLSSLPLEAIPIRNSEGAHKRKCMLQRQIPPHDLNTAPIEEEEEEGQRIKFVRFVKAVASLGHVLEAHDKLTCSGCSGVIEPGGILIRTDPGARTEGSYHPSCFVCATCREPLADLIYFRGPRAEVLCGRDLPTSIGIPRCHACDELIFVRQHTHAEGYDYHVHHFCCWGCDTTLAGKQYISREMNPYCLPCFTNRFGKRCSRCSETIQPTERAIHFNEFAWHAKEECFFCWGCRESLLDRRFMLRNSHPYCSSQCASKPSTSNSN